MNIYSESSNSIIAAMSCQSVSCVAKTLSRLASNLNTCRASTLATLLAQRAHCCTSSEHTISHTVFEELGPRTQHTLHTTVESAVATHPSPRLSNLSASFERDNCRCETTVQSKAHIEFDSPCSCVCVSMWCRATFDCSTVRLDAGLASHLQDLNGLEEIRSNSKWYVRDKANRIEGKSKVRPNIDSLSNTAAFFVLSMCQTCPSSRFLLVAAHP